MADMLHAKRKSVLEDFHGGSPFVSLKPAASASRLSLRARESAVPALSEALGLALPHQPEELRHVGPAFRPVDWAG